jgi:hypothetical protein
LKPEIYWQDHEKRLERIREAIGFVRDNDLRPHFQDTEASNAATQTDPPEDEPGVKKFLQEIIWGRLLLRV